MFIFSTTHEFHYNKIQEDRHQSQLLDLIQHRYGADITVEFVLGEAPSSGDESSSRPEVINKSSHTAENNNSSEEFVSDELKQKLMKDPGLSQLVEDFGAVIKNVD